TTGPSNCVRDVFELIARADSRGDFEVRRPDDVETFKVPGPPTSRSCFVFEITQKSTGAQVRIQVREGVIPEEFFALARTAHSENPGPDAAEAAARFAGVKKALTETMASLPIAELFEWEIVRATQQGG
ncbi:MAG: hypothetical protein JXR94_05630, partial [Candidatus Hydrogenedentes bacterium]|nr:hypothetical protein [Candidatus Hydrogenedentota bacterium]